MSMTMGCYCCCLGIGLSSRVAVRAMMTSGLPPPSSYRRPPTPRRVHCAAFAASTSTSTRPRASSSLTTVTTMTRYSSSSSSSSRCHASPSACGEHSPPSSTQTSSSQSSRSLPRQQQQQQQLHFMESDTVLVTDIYDNVLRDVDVSSSSKMITHRFTSANPRGILHRAFSVFLFDVSTSRLLLQKRAGTKITFPNVWTNTCCSHPLLGMDPPESEIEFEGRGVEVNNDEGGGGNNNDNKVRGAINAAIRKLRHELGIPSDELARENGARFKYLTRVHYWAADTVTHGPDSPWGEHEIDYILFVTIPNVACLTLDNLNDDEVDEGMFDDETLLFSPWFRIIANKWLMGGGGDGGNDGWWDNLDRTMNTNDLCDHDTIHRFDPPPEHMGGAGNAGPLFLN
ncbi:hypothetical protein ACHAXA_006678 [Cyclostephanos tholiformis]|uniref:isopentenyl-diphosphate Delta-isomerase n=1 Tax=Cyclostephanos tholiformis TaxID=382380 RepID=A0ABD3R328_9STRA